MISKHEIRMLWNGDLSHRTVVEVVAGYVGLFQRLVIHVHLPLDDAHPISGNPNHPLDVALRGIKRIVEDHDVSPLNRLQLVNEFVDENALLVLETRKHAGALDTDWLVKEDDKESRKTHR